MSNAAVSCSATCSRPTIGHHRRATQAPRARRRLVREDRYAEARGYLPPKMREVLDRYTAALTVAANEKLPKLRRARAWFDAAVIARYDGMELMGTEGAPDGLDSDGVYNGQASVICAIDVSQLIKDGVARGNESCGELDLIQTSVGIVDRGGCLNLLTPGRKMSPTADGIVPNSCWVEVEKWDTALEKAA